MMTLVFFLEEPSAQEMLKGILPKLLPDQVVAQYIVFQGKQDLEKQLVRKLKHWKTHNSQFLILRDQDSGDCRIIKSSLLEKCREANKSNVIVRVACHELESFYLGDLRAVAKGLNMSGLIKFQNKSKYRDPDRLSNPSTELATLTKNCYQKISGSRAISMHLDLEHNLSQSFNVLIKAIKHAVSP
jgi:hypothetical protein